MLKKTNDSLEMAGKRLVEGRNASLNNFLSEPHSPLSRLSHLEILVLRNYLF